MADLRRPVFFAVFCAGYAQPVTVANSYSSNGAREMPTELRKPPGRESTDLERYGRWQDVLMFVGLLLLGIVIAEWLWRG
jgi:cytochrome c biogenesis protein CcdA